MLFVGQSAGSTLTDVAHMAQRSIPGCDFASVTIIDNCKPRTTVSTSEVAETIDHHQYADDAGPCLEASRTRTVVRVDSFDDDQRWPPLAAVALDQGVHSSLSLPLIALEDPVGALNLYSRSASGFGGAEAAGSTFAKQAAVTLANLTAFHRANDLVANLTRALDHRDIIGQAKGILIAQQHVSADQAFDILRRASQRSNRKLFELAADIVARHTATEPAH
jgi:GAF domain-containing protein